MKKLKVFITLLTLVLLLPSCTTQKFKGKAKATSSHFEMEYSIFTGTKDVTMTLRQGDALSIKMETKKGEVSTSIFLPGQSPIYEIEPSKNGDFRVNIAKDGTYIIRLKGRKAKGSVEIRIIYSGGNVI
ncbi:MAG: hypothetical protein GX297_09480 [Treponema sp.]|nr:hypothetical protein [Treponema sp.]